jgi:hypothetical protein
MIEQVPCGTNEPTVLECSWLPKREMMGRGRVEHIKLGFPEGTFLYIDGGTLDLGLVRDSTLNSTNDFQVFGEIFNNTVFGDG